jgi:hypothetical protein
MVQMLGPQKEPRGIGMLRAMCRSVEKENREAMEVRKEWMAVLGHSQRDIEESLRKCFDLNLAEELEQLGAARRL